MINLAIDYKVTEFLSAIGWKLEFISPISFVILGYKDESVISMCVDKTNQINLDWLAFKDALRKYFKDYNGGFNDIDSDALETLVSEGILFNIEIEKRLIPF